MDIVEIEQKETLSRKESRRGCAGSPPRVLAHLHYPGDVIAGSLWASRSRK